MKKVLYLMGSLAILLLAGCSNEQITSEKVDSNVMRFDMLHPSQISASAKATRATDTGFESGDSVGVFIAAQGTALQLAGNYVNNTKISFNGTAWTPARTIYWDNGTYDIYAYYPFMPTITSVEDQPFTVASDQTTAKIGTALGGYEASDILFANSKSVTASNSAVQLQFKHKMSRLLIQLVKGEDYSGELPDDAEVYVHSTVPSATIDFNAGVVTRNQYGSTQTIKAKNLGSHQYAAIIVPQRLDNRTPLIEVIANGVSYLWESAFVFKPGIQHTVSLVITKNPEQIKIDIGGEIGDWN